MNTEDQSLGEKESSCEPQKLKNILLKKRRNFQTWMIEKKYVKKNMKKYKKKHMKKDEKKGERKEFMKRDEGVET
jgi:hypothetical protein